jgi:hypothetical protein
MDVQLEGVIFIDRSLLLVQLQPFVLCVCWGPCLIFGFRDRGARLLLGLLDFLHLRQVGREELAGLGVGLAFLGFQKVVQMRLAQVQVINLVVFEVIRVAVLNGFVLDVIFGVRLCLLRGELLRWIRLRCAFNYCLLQRFKVVFLFDLLTCQN